MRADVVAVVNGMRACMRIGLSETSCSSCGTHLYRHTPRPSTGPSTLTRTLRAACIKLPPCLNVYLSSHALAAVLEIGVVLLCQAER